MGALAGIFHPGTAKPVEPGRIAAMIAAQAHRGPDGEGVWTAAGVGLGHRRLAITDPAGSAQPMRSGELCVILDGAIVNFADLRTELARKGARFTTRGDTEVLLHGWRAWGAGMLHRLDGSFAFALHDLASGTLLLGRDRLGVKPLHYVDLADGSVAFASELKGLLAHPLVRRVPDVTAIEDYLAYGYVPDDACLVAGVRKLPAAHSLMFVRGRAAPTPRRYWSVSFAERAVGTPRAMGEALIAQMQAGVHAEMRADVPVGALLNGGVDSAAVVALMAEASKAAVRTCAVSLDDAPADRLQAEALAARFATDHRALVVARGDVSPLDTLAWHCDEPFADPDALIDYQRAMLAGRRMTVALSGLGPEVMLAGNRRYRWIRAGARARQVIAALGWSRAVGSVARRFRSDRLIALGHDDDAAYALRVGVMPPDQRARLFSPAARAALQGHRAEARYVAAMRAAPARGTLDRAQYADLAIRLPGQALALSDRIGMAAGLEIRHPLLDHRLVAFAATLPSAVRWRAGEGAWLMKRSLEPYLPREMLYRRAVRRPAPVAAWLRGPLAADLADLPRSRLLNDSGWFDMTVIADWIAGQRGDHAPWVWQMLMLERSLRRLFG